MAKCVVLHEYWSFNSSLAKIKQSDGEALVMLSLTGLLWSGVVVPDRVLSMGQIELHAGEEVLYKYWH